MKLLQRKIDKILRDWKHTENKIPLIVKGARQIGKTASIMQFATENYKNVIAINFVLYNPQNETFRHSRTSRLFS